MTVINFIFAKCKQYPPLCRYWFKTRMQQWFGWWVITQIAILVSHVWLWMITRKSTTSGLRPEVSGFAAYVLFKIVFQDETFDTVPQQNVIIKISFTHFRKKKEIYLYFTGMAKMFPVTFSLGLSLQHHSQFLSLFPVFKSFWLIHHS